VTGRGSAAGDAPAPFDGWIASTGTTSGWRVVIGSWDTGPLGRCDDVMLASPAGHRILLAGSAALAAEIEERYDFDEVRVVPVRCERGPSWRVSAPGADLTLRLGDRPPLARLLRLVPGGVRDAEWFARACDPVARVVVPGVRTHVRARGLRLWYAARDLWSVTAVTGTIEGEDVGGVAPLLPPVTFGGSSAPPTPSLVRVRSHRRAAHQA
jgi:hypothetical protein